MLCHVTLFAIGMGLCRFDFLWHTGGALVVGVYCVAASLCCPIGFLIKGKEGEAIGYVVALIIFVVLMVIYSLIMRG